MATTPVSTGEEHNNRGELRGEVLFWEEPRSKLAGQSSDGGWSMSPEPRMQPGQRALRLVSPASSPPPSSPEPGYAAPASAAGAAAATPAPALSPALRRLQRELEAARAEARSLQELLEELPAILERKFQLRLQAVLLEQRQLEAENALLQDHLLALGGGAIGLPPQPSAPPPKQPALLPPAPAAEPMALDALEGEDSPITQGLGLRRALRLRRR